MSLEVHIEKKLNGFTLRSDFTAGNTATAILGASGCGKSMTLRCIAGIVKPDKGRIVLDGRVLFDSGQHIDLPPQQRGVGLLFQNYALFPNMTVEQNILCGLKAERDKAARKARCAGMLREPFAVINADDYYGPEPFEELYGFLTAPHEENGKLQLCMAGYRLVNTLSDKGTVARGVCTVDANGKLTDIDERLKIGWTADGRITDVSREVEVEYDPQTPVSMNCWGCPPELMEEFQPRFIHFLEHMEDPLKSEFLLPEIIGDLLHEGCAEGTVLPVHNKWYGVTYREDHEKVAAAMAALTADGLYPEKLK